jgi:hypothetical protein
MMDGVTAVIRDVEMYIDSSGNKYALYVIDVRVDSPPHEWNILRRFTDFLNLCNYMSRKSRPRTVECEINSPSTAAHIVSYLSPIKKAQSRSKKLQQYLNSLLSVNDLTVGEIDILKTFLNFVEYEFFLDEMRNQSSRITSKSNGDEQGHVVSDSKSSPKSASVKNLVSDFDCETPDSNIDEHNGNIWRDVISDTSEDPTDKTPPDSLTTHETTDHRPLGYSASDTIPCPTEIISSSDHLVCYPHPYTKSDEYPISVCSSAVADGRPPSYRHQNKHQNSNRPISASISANRTRLNSDLSNTSASALYPLTTSGLAEALKRNDLGGVREVLELHDRLATYADRSGCPAIYTAALYSSLQIALLLIDYGADPYACNQANQLCALDISSEGWRRAVLNRYECKLTMNSTPLTPKIISIEISLVKEQYGFGMKVGRNPDGKAIVIGFATLPPGSINPCLSCDPPIALCDVIYNVDQTPVDSFERCLVALQRISVGSSVRLTVRRAREIDTEQNS